MVQLPRLCVADLVSDNVRTRCLAPLVILLAYVSIAVILFPSSTSTESTPTTLSYVTLPASTVFTDRVWRGVDLAARRPRCGQALNVLRYAPPVPLLCCAAATVRCG